MRLRSHIRPLPTAQKNRRRTESESRAGGDDAVATVRDHFAIAVVTDHLRDHEAPIGQRHARHRFTAHAHHPHPGTNAHSSSRMVSGSRPRSRGFPSSTQRRPLPRRSAQSGRARYTDCHRHRVSRAIPVARCFGHRTNPAVGEGLLSRVGVGSLLHPRVATSPASAGPHRGPLHADGSPAADQPTAAAAAGPPTAAR